MHWWDAFHFLRPIGLVAFPILAGLLLWTFKSSARSSLNDYIDPKLLSHLQLGDETGNSRLPLYLVIVISLALALALSGPSWSKKSLPQIKASSSLMIVLDASPSMAAQDVSPSRIRRASYKLQDLLRERREGSTGLIAYAANAYVVTPLSEDPSIVSELIADISPDLMPAPGSNIEAAMQLAYERLKDQPGSSKSILLVTDGIANEAASFVSGLLANSGIELVIWGFGTENGAPVPDNDGAYITDANGQTIIVSTDHDSLSSIAAQSRGLYVAMTNDRADIEMIDNFASIITDLSANDSRVDKKAGKGVDKDGSKEDKNKQEKTSQETAVWLDQGALFVLIMLPFLALVFRRGIVVPVIFLAFVSFADNDRLSLISVASASDLSQSAEPSRSSPDAYGGSDGLAVWWAKFSGKLPSLANSLYAQGEFAKATELFSQVDSKDAAAWAGASSYREGNYEGAIKHFEEAIDNAVSRRDRADAFYNLANALARSGRLEAAVQKYQEALEIYEDFEDAAFNKALVEKLIDRKNQSNENAQSENQQSENQQSDGDSSSTDSSSQSDSNQDSVRSKSAEGSQNAEGSQRTEGSQTAEDSQTAEGSESSNENSPGTGDQDDNQTSEYDPNSGTATNELSGEEQNALSQTYGSKAEAEADKAGELDTEKEDNSRANQELAANGEQTETENLRETGEAPTGILMGQRDNALSERERRVQQQLLRVEDNPGGLLRNKFLYERQQRYLEFDNRRRQPPGESSTDRL